MKYSELKPQLQTGDLMLFGAAYAESKVIEQITGYPWSHSGMVVFFPDKAPGPLFWEAVTDVRTFRDPFDHNLQHLGARIVNLDHLLAYYTPYTNLQFTYRHLTVNWTPALQANLEAFVQKMDGTPFPSELQMLVDYVLGHYRNISTGLSPIFCAQLVAATYQAVGLLGPSPYANYYAPGDLSSLANIVLNGASLGPDILVDYDGIVDLTPPTPPVPPPVTRP